MKPLILTIDDDPDIQEVYALALDDYTVLQASSGMSALVLLERHKPDLILLDMLMQGHEDGLADGLWFLEQMHAAGMQYPVIAVACNANLLEEAGKRGVVATVPKPFELDDLLATIEHVLQAREVMA